MHNDWRGIAASLRRRWQDQRADLHDEWRTAGLWTDDTLWQVVLEGARRFPETRLTCLGLRERTEFTLPQLVERAEQTANGLAALGLRAGDVMLVQSPSWHEAALSFLASLRLGAVILPIVHIFGPAEIGGIARRSGARLMVLPDQWRGMDIAARLEKMGPMPPDCPVVVTGDPAAAGPALSWIGLSGPHPDAPAASAAPDDVCALLYTSGTTSQPKGVLHTHRSLLAEVRSNTRYLRVEQRPAFLNALLAGHIGGLLAMLRPFVYGFDSIFMEKWDGPAAAALVRDYPIGWSNGAPFHLTSLLDNGATGDGIRLGAYVVGAASVPPSLVERAAAAGVGATRSYGLTEHPTVSTCAPDDPITRRANTDGRLMDGTRVRIVDDEGHDLPVGEAGEILSVGPELFLGYTDPENNAEAFTPDGWFRTGDIGVLDDEGYLSVVDRKKDIIIRGGENISSREVEDLVCSHPAVRECAVVGMPDPVLGERVAAYVRLAEGRALSIDDLLAHFAARGVARQKTPEHLVVLDEDFPRNTTGKVLKPVLRDGLRHTPPLRTAG